MDYPVYIYRRPTLVLTAQGVFLLRARSDRQIRTPHAQTYRRLVGLQPTWVIIKLLSANELNATDDQSRTCGLTKLFCGMLETSRSKRYRYRRG